MNASECSVLTGIYTGATGLRMCFQGCGEDQRQHPQSRQQPRLGEEFPPAAERVEDGEDRSYRHPPLCHLLVAVLQRRAHRLRRVKQTTSTRGLLPVRHCNISKIRITALNRQPPNSNVEV